MKQIFTLLSFLGISIFAQGQWSNTSNQFYDSLHMSVSAATGIQQNSYIVKSYPDSGYFVIWEDYRNTAVSKRDIYAQKYDKNGNTLWAANGVPVSDGTNDQHFTWSSNEDYRSRPLGATDSAGGFYLAYTDDSIDNYDWQRMCVQHMRGNGTQVFPGVGYIVAAPPSGQSVNYSSPELIADDDGGFYIAYVQNNGNDYLYIYNYKDIGGTMVLNGGGRANDNGYQLSDPGPCVGTTRWTVIYPGTTVHEYNIWPDLQGGCSVVMSMNGNTGGQGKMLCYNRLWKAKKAAHVSIATQWPTGDPNTLEIDYPKGTVDMLYKLRTNALDANCTSPAGYNVWVDYLLLSNGYLLLDQGGYDYNYPKGVTVTTSGNINAELIAVTTRSLDGNSVTPFIVKGFGSFVEKYDSVPYQRASNDNIVVGYNPVVPAQLNKMNYFRDTLLATSTYYNDFSLAGGGSQLYAASLLYQAGSGRDVRLQHLAVERQSADSFAMVIKASSNQGELIGRELNTGFGGSSIQYDFPAITVNPTGNALFYIREYGQYIRVSPITNGAQLAWGAMGRPIGTPIANGSYYYPDLPYVALDPVNGTGLISWQDSRNLPASPNTNTNIFMRHLDSLNVVDYTPLDKKVQALGNFSTQAFPTALLGNSKNYSTFDGYNNLTGYTSPVVSILDNYNLGAVVVLVYENPGAIRTANGHAYLNRNFLITPEHNPAGAANINVRLFFTTAEFDALKAANPAISSPGDLGVIKQPGSGNNAPAAYTPDPSDELLAPLAWKAVSGGYYIEVSVKSFSNFFIQQGVGPLPLTWVDVKAKWIDDARADVNWLVAQEENVKDYIVQASTDGRFFSDVCTVIAAGLDSYHCEVPAIGSNKYYYRVLQRDLDGKSSFSKVVSLGAYSAVGSFVLSPNPAHDYALLHTDGPAIIRSLRLMNMSGVSLWQQNNPSGSSTHIPLQTLSPGVYSLRIQLADGSVVVRKLVKR